MKNKKNIYRRHLFMLALRNVLRNRTETLIISLLAFVLMGSLSCSILIYSAVSYESARLKNSIHGQVLLSGKASVEAIQNDYTLLAENDSIVSVNAMSEVSALVDNTPCVLRFNTDVKNDKWLMEGSMAMEAGVLPNGNNLEIIAEYTKWEIDKEIICVYEDTTATLYITGLYSSDYTEQNNLNLFIGGYEAASALGVGNVDVEYIITTDNLITANSSSIFENMDFAGDYTIKNISNNEEIAVHNFISKLESLGHVLPVCTFLSALVLIEVMLLISFRQFSQTFRILFLHGAHKFDVFLCFFSINIIRFVPGYVLSLAILINQRVVSSQICRMLGYIIPDDPGNDYGLLFMIIANFLVLIIILFSSLFLIFLPKTKYVQHR